MSGHYRLADDCRAANENQGAVLGEGGIQGKSQHGLRLPAPDGQHHALALVAESCVITPMFPAVWVCVHAGEFPLRGRVGSCRRVPVRLHLFFINHGPLLHPAPLSYIYQ